MQGSHMVICTSYLSFHSLVLLILYKVDYNSTSSRMLWRERPLCSLRPISMGGHCCQAIQLNVSEPVHHSVVVIGGGDAFGVCYNDVHCIEPTEGDAPWRCTMLEQHSHTMSKRMGHTAITCCSDVAWAGDRPDDVSVETVILFGGYQAVPDTTHYGDVYAIGLHQRWYELLGTWNAPQLIHTRLLPCTGSAPAPRHSHASCSTNGGTHMVVMGGSTASGVVGDCFELDIRARVWREVILTSHIPREMTACVTLDVREGSPLLIAGGRDMDGNLLDDVVVLQPTTSQTDRVVLRAHSSIQASPVCCHTILSLAPHVSMAVGGLCPAGSAPYDTLLVTNEEGAAVAVPLPRHELRNGERSPAAAIFGFGHSCCSWVLPNGKSTRHIVISGLTPHATTGTMEVYELTSQ